MIFQLGSPILVVHRRLFENDHSRYFLGVVESQEGLAIRVKGHTWVQDRFNSKFVKKEDPRTKILGIAGDGLILYALPDAISLNELKFEIQDKGKLFLHDNKNFKMDLSETCHAE